MLQKKSETMLCQNVDVAMKISSLPFVMCHLRIVFRHLFLSQSLHTYISSQVCFIEIAIDIYKCKAASVTSKKQKMSHSKLHWMKVF